ELNAAVAGSALFQGMYDFSIAAHFGDLRFRQKRYDEARKQYEKALSGSLQVPMNPMGDQLIKLGIYDKLARLEAVTGHPKEALLWNDKTLDVVRAARNPLQECVTLITRGHLLTRSERFAEAETTLQQAMKIADSAKNGPRQASIHSALGTLHIMSGNYGKAASHLERSVQLYRSLNDPVSEAATWGSLSHAYLLADNLAAAEDALVNARKLVNKTHFPLGPDMIALSETWLRFRKGQATTKDVRNSMDKFMRNAETVNIDIADDVQQVVRQTLKVLESGKLPGKPRAHFSMPMFRTYELMFEGMELIEQGDTEGAQTVWRDALENSPSSDVRSGLLGLIGASALREGNVEQASRAFAESVDLLDTIGDDLSSPGMRAPFGSSYHRTYYDISIETLLREGKIGQAFDTTERARARAFLRLLGNHRLKRPTGSPLAMEAEALRKKIDEWDETTHADETFVDVRQRYVALQTRLQAAAPEYASMTTFQPLSLAAIQKNLPADTTLINYFVTSFGTHAWIVDAESVEWIPLSVPQHQMERITCWAFDLAKSRSSRPEDDVCGDPVHAEEAYAALIAPLREKIRKPRLMIVPHADLHYVPFAALYDSERGAYLVEDYPISYVPSASTLPLLCAKESPVRRRALVLGDPVAVPYPPLPGARIEAQKVAKKFRTKAHLGTSATEKLLHSVREVDLLHIAAHATYDPVSPLFSAIHLAKDSRQDGQLSVDEIQSKIDLTGVNLVVLSACQSGVGSRSGGDEIISLTRAILYAGSPGVISTLWNISDEATPPLIEMFYDRLLAGASPADALRIAQVTVLHGAEYASPRYWAAFCLTGDPVGNWAS
ncbi:MAG TPA: CHAT domain-containing tetratricopeptide repeat protein, partial [Thermoanaerobaculia bacterium]